MVAARDSWVPRASARSRLPRFPRRSRNGSSSASLAGSAPDRPRGGPHRGRPGASLGGRAL